MVHIVLPVVTRFEILGLAYMDHGACSDPTVSGKVDRGSAINTIALHNMTSKNCTGMVVSRFLVGVADVSNDDWSAWCWDCLEVLERDYEQATGVSPSGGSSSE